MSVSKNAIGVMSICAAVLMGGCGGSGSDGSAGLPTLDVPAAEADVTSGTEAATMLVGSDYTSGIGIFSVSSASAKKFNPVSYIKRQLTTHNGISPFSTGIQPTVSQDFSENCYVGGSVTYSASVNDAGTGGSATVTYDQCSDGYGVVDGTIEMAVTGTGLDGYDYALKTSNLLFATDFMLTSNGSTTTIHQGTYVDDTYTTFDLNNAHYTGTETSSLWIDYDSEYHYRYDDMTVRYDNDEYTNGTRSSCYQSGRIYVGNLTAYLDINAAYDPDCNDPFYWDDAYTYPLRSGSMELLGSNGSKVLVKADPNSYDLNVTAE